MKRLLLCLALVCGAASAANYPTAPMPYQVLDTTKIVSVKIGEAVTTTAPTYAIAYQDVTETSTTAGYADGSFTTSFASACAAPAQGTRQISSITICNIDTVSHTIYVQKAATGTPGTATAVLLNAYTMATNTTIILTVSGPVSSTTPLALPVTVPNGGTGDTSLASNGIPYGNGTSALQVLAAPTSSTKQFLTSTGTGSVSQAPAFGTIAAADVPSLDASKITTGLLPLNLGGTNANLTASNGGVVWSNATQLQILGGTATANKILYSGATATPNWSVPTFPVTASATSGKVIQSDGTNWVASTPTFPTGAAASGVVLSGNGTNWVASTPTFPTSASATALKWMRSDGTNWIASSSTLAEGSVTTGRFLQSDGTNWIASACTVPSSAGASTNGKAYISDGTNFQALYPQLRYETVTFTANAYTVLQSDAGMLIGVTCGSTSDQTVTLPAAATVGAGYTIGFQKVDSGSKAILIACNASDTINGASSANNYKVGTQSDVNHTGQYAFMSLTSTGSGNSWIVTAVGGDMLYATSTTAVPHDTFTTLCSITLTPGEWDISAQGDFSAGTVNAGTGTILTVDGGGTLGDNRVDFPGLAAAPNAIQSPVLTSYRKVVTANTTINLQANATTSNATGTATNNGSRLSARRIR